MSSTLSSFGFDEDDFAPSILQAIEDAVSLPPMALCDSNVYDAVLCSAPLPPMLPSPSMGGFSFPGVACFPPVPPFLGHVSPQEIRPVSFFSCLRSLFDHFYLVSSFTASLG